MRRKYTKKEERILRHYWKTHDPEEIAEFLRSECGTVRTPVALTLKARKMGIIPKKTHKWTEWEVELLQRNETRGGLWLVNMIEKEMGYRRSLMGVYVKRCELRKAKRQEAQTESPWDVESLNRTADRISQF